MTLREKVYNLTRLIDETAKYNNQRTGQYLFNCLFPAIQERVRGTVIDPFHKQLSFEELYSWIENHIIFDEDGRQIGLFSGDVILWERE